tara:strand:+ start:48 stop:704 length:657 start_codon:yes stop_codon:yes gene_type:complete
MNSEMNEETINKLAEWLYIKYIDFVKNPDTALFISLPIDKIDGVKIEHTTLRIETSRMELYYVIENHLYENDIKNFKAQNEKLIVFRHTPYKDFGGCLDECFTLEGLKHALSELNKYLSKLYFHNLGGYFTSTVNIADIPIKLLTGFLSVGVVKPKILEECVICYEHTKTHFKKCNHVVCVRCISNMNKHITCPMCRACIKTRDYDEYDSSSNESDDE